MLDNAGLGLGREGPQLREKPTSRTDEAARAERPRTIDAQGQPTNEQEEAGSMANGTRKFNASELFGRGVGTSQARSSRPTEGGSKRARQPKIEVWTGREGAR